MFKAYMKMDKKIIKFGDTKFEKIKQKSPISINNIDIRCLIRFLSVKRVLNILLVTKMVKIYLYLYRLDLYVY